MPDVVWSMIALSLGFTIYIAPAAFGVMLPVESREKLGNFYYGMAMKSFRQVAIVRRLIGGLAMLPIYIDDRQKVAQVTLSSGLISDDQNLPFKDPDNRILRLFDKPLTVLVEEIPAALDAELSEIGYWVREHDTERGLFVDGKINPYFKMDSKLRIVDPIDALEVIPNNVHPENIETAEELTKQRFQKYGSRIGAAETIGTLMGFAFGVGAVAAIAYLRQNTLDGSTSSDPTEVWPIFMDNTWMLDVVVTLI